ncbi:MAG: nickel pincer cofactor biosynthesis protein LarC [Calditerrivibrio sp.]|nr:nickel pincer cofactor biosynthesis protein LarC [Calditerrivibrio sp.]
MEKLYFDINSGISGDMTLAVLLQASPRGDELSSILSNIFKVDIGIKLVDKFINGILCKRVQLNIPHEPHIHRDFKYIKKKIEDSDLKDNVKKDSIAIFSIIAESEAKIHGKTVDDIHFHEVGSIDSIIDIIGASYLLNAIGRPKVESSPTKLGYGIVNTAHGLIPVPAPATVDILKDFPVERVNIPSELTTPTGAAILKYYVERVDYTFRGVIKNCYYSTGTKEFENLPNILRLLEIDEGEFVENLLLIETNLDDMTGEQLGDILNLALSMGALDAFFTPIYMKKNRPSYKLSVICKEENRDKIAELILQYTTSAGIRFSRISRYEMDREFVYTELKGFRFKVKKLRWKGIVKFSPEWENLKELSTKLNIPPYQLYCEVIDKISREAKDE